MVVTKGHTCLNKHATNIYQKLKDVIIRNLRDTISYMKKNVLQDFHICISVPLNELNNNH